MCECCVVCPDVGKWATEPNRLWCLNNNHCRKPFKLTSTSLFCFVNESRASCLRDRLCGVRVTAESFPKNRRRADALRTSRCCERDINVRISVLACLNRVDVFVGVFLDNNEALVRTALGPMLHTCCLCCAQWTLSIVLLNYYYCYFFPLRLFVVNIRIVFYDVNCVHTGCGCRQPTINGGCVACAPRTVRFRTTFHLTKIISLFGYHHYHQHRWRTMAVAGDAVAFGSASSFLQFIR